jgi:hypothetical protein
MNKLKQPMNYEQAKANSGQSEKLPPGGYICRIRTAEEVTFSNGNAGLKIAFDISDGDYEGYYAKRFETDKMKANENTKFARTVTYKGFHYITLPKDDAGKDDVTLRKSKAFWETIEQSNPYFVWDWNLDSLKGKKFGGVFGLEQYRTDDGKEGFFTRLRFVIIADRITKGTFAVPDPLYKARAAGSIDVNELEPVDDDLPF